MQLGYDIEAAIRLLTTYFVIGEQYGKPVIAHSIRVGNELYQRDYPRDVIIAGFLHDILEDTAITAYEIEQQFGAEVLRLIQANTKDKTIEDAPKRHFELMKRCVQAGQAAIIVKCADILDNFAFYASIKDEANTANCKNNARILSELISKVENLKPDPLMQKVYSLS